MVEPTDDRDIPHTARLWRRIVPDWVEPLEHGGSRPKSISFKDRRSDAVSIHIAELTTPDRILEAYPGVLLAEITAGLVRSIGCGVFRDPTPTDPSHALIRPSPTTSGARTLAKASRWVA